MSENDLRDGTRLHLETPSALRTHFRPQDAYIAYSCRHVPSEHIRGISTGAMTPTSGDLVLARIDRIGQHKGLETAQGRRVVLYEGDTIIVAYGARYAMNQFEAAVPGNLGPCHLVAAGGVAGEVLSAHQRMSRATAITPIGLVTDASGTPLNLRNYGIGPVRTSGRRPLTIAVLGSTMDAGKTTVTAQLIRGLTRAGWNVGAVKATGTASPRDVNQFRDAGARTVLDFSDLGVATTYLQPADVVEALVSDLAAAASPGNDVVMLEVADGLLQQETAALIRSACFFNTVDGVLLAAGDPLCAMAGVSVLNTLGLPLLAVSGVLTSAPLAIREAGEVIRVPVIHTMALSDPGIADVLKLERQYQPRAVAA